MFCEFILEDGKKYLCNLQNVNGIRAWGDKTTMIIFSHHDTLKVMGTYEEIRNVIVGGQQNG